MKKLLLPFSLVMFSMLAFANENTNLNINKDLTSSNVLVCTITATCPDGSTITATAADCETAGRMIDAGCGEQVE